MSLVVHFICIHGKIDYFKSGYWFPVLFILPKTQKFQEIQASMKVITIYSPLPAQKHFFLRHTTTTMVQMIKRTKPPADPAIIGIRSSSSEVSLLFFESENNKIWIKLNTIEGYYITIFSAVFMHLSHTVIHIECIIYHNKIQHKYALDSKLHVW